MGFFFQAAYGTDANGDVLVARGCVEEPCVGSPAQGEACDMSSGGAFNEVNIIIKLSLLNKLLVRHNT